MQVYKVTSLQLDEFTKLCVNNLMSLQVEELTSWWVYKLMSLQVYKLTSLQTDFKKDFVNLTSNMSGK